MNETDDNSRETDPAVRTAYRELAQEQVPRDLDREVLSQSRKAVESRSMLNQLTNWLRPLAFVATAGLSLALIIQLGNTPDTYLPDNAPPGVAPLPANVFQDAAGQASEQLRQLEEIQSTSVPPPSTSPRAPAAATSPDLSLLPASERCDDEARATSGTWWQCIRELEQRGLPEVAERELQALLKSYPQFSAPQ